MFAPASMCFPKCLPSGRITWICGLKQNAALKEKVGGHSAPDRNEEYFLYETLLGVWPLDQQSLRDCCRRESRLI